MGLIGALSNHRLQQSLARLADALASSTMRRARGRAMRAYRRSRPGTILNAAVEVLAAADRAMSPKQVHAAVEALLGVPVRRGSIKQALAGNIAGKRGRSCFERVGRGKYRCLGL